MTVVAANPRRTYINFHVTGVPVAQGSMIVQRGRIRHQSADRLKTWRDLVAQACREEMRDTTHWKPEVAPLYTPWAGPVVLELYFTYQPAKKAQSEQEKTTTPDLDKLTRAVLDALTGVLYADDKQVVRLEVSKSYGTWAPANEGGPEATTLSVSARLL